MNDVELARARRRRLPDRPQGVADRARLPEAEVRGRQRRRVGARRLQGPPGDGHRAAPADRGLPDRRARDRVEGRFRLHPGRVPGRVRDRWQAAGRRGRGGGALRRRRGSSSTAAPARISAARRRRCWIRWRDDAASRARAPVPAGAGALRRADAGEQRLHDRDAPDRDLDGCRRVREDRRADRAGHRNLLDLPQRRQARQVRAGARDADAGVDRGPRGEACPTAAS